MFALYVEHFLCAELKPCGTVIMDNLSAHKVAAIKPLIETKGARLAYLPPYFLDFIPIEKAFAQIKAHLRQSVARTKETLENAIAEAIENAKLQHAQNYFKSCAYKYEPI